MVTVTEAVYLEEMGALWYAFAMENLTEKPWRVEKALLATGGFKAIPEEEAQYWEKNPPKH